MLYKIKNIIKRVCAFFGLCHPSLGIKIHPPAKAAMVVECKPSAVRVFVETGTEFGTMIKKVQNHFESIYSIEMDRELYEKAVNLFKGQENIKLFLGDSATKIKDVLLELNEPALFWLDAHGPGEMSFDNPQHCPAEKELEAIFEHSVKGHVVLIDDARKFDLASISKIKEMAKKNDYTFTIVDGIFRLFPGVNT